METHDARASGRRICGDAEGDRSVICQEAVPSARLLGRYDVGDVERLRVIMSESRNAALCIWWPMLGSQNR